MKTKIFETVTSRLPARGRAFDSIMKIFLFSALVVLALMALSARAEDLAARKSYLIGNYGYGLAKADRLASVLGTLAFYNIDPGEIDLTARNVQDEAKKKGLPWSIAKGFDTFCPVGPCIVPRDEVDLGKRRLDPRR